MTQPELYLDATCNSKVKISSKVISLLGAFPFFGIPEEVVREVAVTALHCRVTLKLEACESNVDHFSQVFSISIYLSTIL